MSRLAAALVLALAAASATGQPAHYPVELVRVIDGDTVVARVHVWPNWWHETRIRLRGVNAAERRTKRECERAAAERATVFVEQLVAGAALEIRDVQPGTWSGRYVAELVADGRSVSDALVAAGHAVPYAGRSKRKPWVCRRAPE